VARSANDPVERLLKAIDLALFDIPTSLDPISERCRRALTYRECRA
jgi:hypothetical protein